MSNAGTMTLVCVRRDCDVAWLSTRGRDCWMCGARGVAYALLDEPVQGLDTMHSGQTEAHWSPSRGEETP